MDELHKLALEVARRILESPDGDENAALARTLLEQLKAARPQSSQPQNISLESA
jgi:hypothetical protein